MIGKISKVYERESGEKKFLVLDIGGDKYSLWNPELLQGLPEGSTVEYEFNRKGKFKNITTLKPAPVPTGQTVPQNPEPKTKTTQQTPEERDGFVPNELITQMTSLKYAVMTTQNWSGEPVEKAEKTLGIAEAYKLYMKGEDYLPKLRAILEGREPGEAG